MSIFSKLWRKKNKKMHMGARSMYTYKATEIAKWFLAENELRLAEGDSDYITHLKLQKLLYYAQGCYMAIKDRLLFSENILAWEHGPVVEEVYREYKQYGSNPIVFSEPYNPDAIDRDTQAILREVFDVFGQYSAWKLREMTHQEEPWLRTEQSEIIDPKLIKEYFKKEYVE